LDYYVHTVFELTHSGLGAGTAIAGGGRYELYLPGQNRPLPGVGFAAGVERLLLSRQSLGLSVKEDDSVQYYLIGLGEKARLANLALANRLRQAGIKTALEVEDRSFKAQLRAANRYGAKATIIRGEDEINRGIAIYKPMFGEEKEQKEIADSELENFLKSL
jgi:histidyl-tRNA synthetase